MLRCQICKKLFKQLGTHLKTHNITGEEYKKKFNVKHLQCRSLRKKQSEFMKGNDYLLDFKFLKKSKRKMSKSGKMRFKNGEKQWNEGLTKETSSGVAAIALKASKNKEKSRIRMNKMYEDGTLIPGTGVRCKMYPVVNYILGEKVKVQGRLEKRFAELLNRLGIRWVIPKYKIYLLDGKEHKYFCDFWLPGERYYIEVKSKYYYNLHKEEVLAKKQMMVERGKRKGFRYKIMFLKSIEILERRCVK